LEPARKKDSARLQWDTKPRRAVNPKDIDFQTAEIVIPNPARDQKTITSFANTTNGSSLDKSQMNRLIWGDNLLAMQALLSSGYEGKINLIYIDPPFWTNENYYSTFEIEGTEITKTPSVIERLAYKDIWDGGIDSFLDMLYPRMQLMKRLLADNGSIFVHLDYHIGHYAKIILDEIFGVDNFRNEIIVKRGRKKGLMYQFEKVDRMHVSTDTVLLYTKSSTTKFGHPISETKGSESKWMGFWSNVDRPTMRYELFGVIPPRGQWKWERERAQRAVDNYKQFETWFAQNIDPSEYAHLPENKKDILKDVYLEQYWRTMDQKLEFIRMRQGVKYPEYWVKPKEHMLIDNLWTDIEAYDYSSGYPTEKHIELLRRIISNFSEEGDVVADFFAGSGTTMLVAESLNRRWIGCDFSKVGVQVARGRLVQSDSKPFLIENIGNYQRQLIYLTGSRIYEIQPIVLKLYGATPRKDYPDLGVRQIDGTWELVYVSYPDRPVSAKKVDELELLAEHLDGRGYQRLVILGWDYEYSYDELLRDRERTSKRKWHTQIVSKTIPPEVYEYLKKIKTADEVDSMSGRIQFYEKPYLRLLKPEIKQNNGKYEVTVGIDKYVVFDLPVEKDEQKKEIQEILREKPLALIDYWAVDWNYDGMTFRSGWQAMRRLGRKTVPIPRTTSKEIESGRSCTVAIRVVDIFGNDAGNSLKIQLR
jgi:DNA modification methylase